VSNLVAIRLRNALALLLCATLFCFILVVSAPGNVAQLVAELRSPRVTPEAIQAIEIELGLHDPLIMRYGRWLSGALQGDLGISYKTGQDIGAGIASRLPITATLVAGGMVFAVLFSLVLGFLGALLGRFGDTLTRAIAVLGASVPTFFLGAMLILLMGVTLGLLPTFGSAGLISWILPWVTLGVMPAAVLSRVVRVGLEEAMTRPYALTAVAKGLSPRGILWRHALPNVAPSYVNALCTQCASMVAGTIVVEPLFALKGVSDMFLQAALFRDFMVVQAVLFLFLVCYILIFLIADIGLIFTDPKLRRQGAN
jgi:peptide/nickel transport system permease protein